MPNLGDIAWRVMQATNEDFPLIPVRMHNEFVWLRTGNWAEK